MRLPAALTALTMAEPSSPGGPLPFAAARHSRRAWMARSAGLLAAPALLAAGNAQALPARALQFPRDHGSHPELRTEWWYITGHVQAGARPWGFQITFFRSRVPSTQSMRSAFAAKQLLFAHAALTDVQGATLRHDQRMARTGFGLAQASEQDTQIILNGWTLQRTSTGPAAQPHATSHYSAHMASANFGLDLQFDSQQPVLLQGQQGLSRKGPQPDQASYYYSQPQLAVSGSLTIDNQRLPVVADSGRAWMDHEWSEALMHPEAVGWDWVGMNLDDGSALTAFQLRRADGSALWTGGSFRPAGQPAQIWDASAVQFTASHLWSSPRTGARYPMRWHIQTPAGRFEVRSQLDDQELDSRGSTGAVYWEGLSALLNPAGHTVGRGYLEMTGYAQPLRL